MQFEFPIKKHRFTTDEFNAKKAAYVAKYGYTIHIPGFHDIFKLGVDYKPTEEEVELYRKKDIGALGLYKFNKIAKVMKKNKEAFLRMMSSPNPRWVNNIGTTMTFLDDINDTAGTLAVVARTAAHLLPKAVGRLFMGPAGWALSLADVVGVAMSIARSPLDRLTRKSYLADGFNMNPFSKEAKVSRSKRLKRLKPSKGEIIEALQVTNNIFGIGLSLGSLVGAFLESITGPVRVLQGKKVRVKWPWPKLQTYEKEAMRGLYAARCLTWGTDELSEEDHTKIYLVAEMATQVLYPLFEEYHPLDNIDGLENIVLTPPRVTDPLKKLLFAEEKIDPDKFVGIPGAEDTDGSVNEIMDTGPTRGFTELYEYARRNRNTDMGVLGMQAANNAAENLLALWEGPDQVQVEPGSVLKAAQRIIEAGWFFAEATNYRQVSSFIRLVSDLARDDIYPDFNYLNDTLIPQCYIRLEPCEGLRNVRLLQEAIGMHDWKIYIETGSLGISTAAWFHETYPQYFR